MTLLYDSIAQSQRLFRMEPVRIIRTDIGMKTSNAATALKRLREQAKMSVREVAEKLDRPASTYASYEDKFKKPFLPLELVNALVPIFGAKGIGRGDVMKLAGIAIESSDNASSPNLEEKITTPTVNVQQWPRDLPILGAGACGEDGLFELNGQIHGFERRPPRLVGVKDAYALWVMGNSMFPWRRNGQIVIVHPHQPVNIGDYVVVQLKPDGTEQHGAYIKELVRRTAKEVRLRQYSPEEEITISMSKVASIHRIPSWDEMVIG